MMDADRGCARVLLSPAHYYLDDKVRGSELIWAATIIKGIADSGRYFLDIITGYVESLDADPRRLAIHEIDRSTDMTVSAPHALAFMLKKSATSWRLCRKNRYDIIHHMFPFQMDATFDLTFIFRNRESKYVFGPVQSPQTFHTAAEPPEAAWYAKPFLKLREKALARLCRLTLRRADVVLAITERAKEMLLERGIEAGRIRVINPGIDVEKFRFLPLAEKKSETIELIAVGYLIERKAFDLVIKAMEKVVETRDDVRLRIVGDGPLMTYLRELTDSLGLEDFVIFEGFVPHMEIPSLYRKAHVFVSMSRSESWGQVYLEAMASGLPVVSAANTGAREIISDGVFGYLVDDGDYEKLASRLISLIEDRELLAEFGRKAREEVEAKYDWKTRIIPQYLEVYDSLKGDKRNMREPQRI